MLNLTLISRKFIVYLSLIGLIGGCVLGNEKLLFSALPNGLSKNKGVQFRFTPEKIKNMRIITKVLGTSKTSNVQINNWVAYER